MIIYYVNVYNVSDLIRFVAILFRPSFAPKHLMFIVTGDGYYRNAPCALNLISNSPPVLRGIDPVMGKQIYNLQHVTTPDNPIVNINSINSQDFCLRILRN
jgi:hypothetical protein